ncbi:hypothetical protein [Rhodoferax sp. WC2427]|uniref:hypothetical protein n=1 Tax=Rhodoferax sp. WC2427 TaxID=3234144 RepID=UPI0034653C39
MTLVDLLSIVSSVAASAAAVMAYLGKEAVGVLQRQHDSALRQIEESHKTELAKQLEDFKKSLAFFGAVDTELRSMRIRSYSALWQQTRVLPKWPKDASVGYQALTELSAALRGWYFGGNDTVPGGMLLTVDAMNAYKALQSQIAEVVSVYGIAHDTDQALAPGDYEAVRRCASALRTELTKDLLSRRETPGS